MIWVLDLEVLEHGENIRYLEIPKGWIRGNKNLAQYWNSRSRIICINVELKSELHA